ncbi:hypothetical protein HHX47_DHR10000235, partial [Lentinula edodes]
THRTPASASSSPFSPSSPPARSTASSYSSSISPSPSLSLNPSSLNPIPTPKLLNGLPIRPKLEAPLTPFLNNTAVGLSTGSCRSGSGGARALPLSEVGIRLDGLGEVLGGGEGVGESVIVKVGPELETVESDKVFEADIDEDNDVKKATEGVG